jgi:ubiquitin C
MVRKSMKIPENKRVAYVYKVGEAPLCRDTKRIEGVWTKPHGDVNQSPQEVWIYNKGQEPADLAGSKHVHGVWGYKPGLSDPESSCTPNEMWFYTPQEEFPSYFTPRGVWTLPLIKKDISEIAPDSAGFLSIGAGQVHDKLDVAGTWKMLYQRDGLPEQPIGPGIKKDRSAPPKPPPKMQLIVKNGVDGKKFPIMVLPTDTIDSIKDQIEEKTGIPKKDQNLFFQGKELLDDRPTVADCNMESGDVLDLVPTWKLNVKTPEGKTIKLTNVRPTDTVSMVQQQVLAKEGIPIKDQRLTFQGKPLTNGTSTLVDNGIQNEDTLELEGMKIRIKTPDGKRVLLDIQPNDTIATVKAKAAPKLGIPAKDQRLVFDGVELNNDTDTLQDVGIQHGDTIDLEPMEIKVKTPQGKIIPITTKPSDTIKDIKKKVQQKLNIPVKEQRLVFGGDELEDGDTLEDAGIRHGDVIDLEGMQIQIKTPDGKVFPLNVQPTDTILMVKQRVQTQEGVPVREQHLFFKKDRELDDAPTLSEKGIRHGDTLLLQGMKLNVVTPQGKTISIDTSPKDTVLEIKQKIADKTGIPVKDQILTHKGDELDNNGDTMDDVGIQHGDTIDLEGMKISVRTPDGKLIPIPNVQPSNTVQDIKKKIQQLEGVPLKEQRLLLDGQELDNPKATLEKMGIRNNDILDLGGMQIKVRTPKGNIVVVDVKPHDTVPEVKQLLEDLTGMPVDQQHLIFKGKELPNGPSLAELGVQHNDTLDLEGMKLNVKTPDGKTLVLPVEPSDTVKDIKKKILKMTGVPLPEQHLMYKGTELEKDGDTLEDLGIPHDDTVDLEGMKVKVKTPDGTTIPIDVTLLDTIDDLKKKVQLKSGIPAGDQRLIFKGEDLDDPDQTLEDAKIKHRDLIHMGDGIRIKVKTLDGKLIPIDVSPTDTIVDVKKQVKSKEGIPVKNQRMLMPKSQGDKELNDPDTLKKCGIKHGDILELGPMQINVKLLDGRIVPFNVDPEDTVDDVKTLIEKKERIPAKDQRLFFKKAELTDASVLSDCGVTHGSTLELGGMQIIVNTPDGRPISIDVTPNDTIQEVKKKLADKSGIPEKDQHLLYKGQELNDPEATLDDCGIQHGSQLDMGGMLITINCPGGRYLPLQVTPSDTIGEIKQRIENHEFVPVGLQRLLFQDKLLENPSSLKSYNIKHGALLDLRGMRIHINVPSGKKVTLEVMPLWSINDVKREVADMEGGLNMGLHKLKRGDKELTNKPTLKYYNIQHDEVLDLEEIPTYDVEMSAWQSPFEIKAKPKIKREGVRAKKGGPTLGRLASP